MCLFCKQLAENLGLACTLVAWTYLCPHPPSYQSSNTPLPSCAFFARRQVAEDLGFSMETGRLDVSVHPFTSGFHPTDVRITSRYKEDNLTEGLTGTVHETGVWMFAGYAWYIQGCNIAQNSL